MTLDEARMILNIKEPTLEHEEEMVKVSIKERKETRPSNGLERSRSKERFK